MKVLFIYRLDEGNVFEVYMLEHIGSVVLLLIS